MGTVFDNLPHWEQQTKARDAQGSLTIYPPFSVREKAAVNDQAHRLGPSGMEVGSKGAAPIAP